MSEGTPLTIILARERLLAKPNRVLQTCACLSRVRAQSLHSLMHVGCTCEELPTLLDFAQPEPNVNPADDDESDAKDDECYAGPVVANQAPPPQRGRMVPERPSLY